MRMRLVIRASCRSSSAGRRGVRNSTLLASRDRASRPSGVPYSQPHASPGFTIACRRASSSPAGACSRGSRSLRVIDALAARRRCRARAGSRWPPISKLCGDSNSSVPNPAARLGEQPLRVAVVACRTRRRATCCAPRTARARTASSSRRRAASSPRPPPASAARARRSPAPVVRVRHQSDAHQLRPPLGCRRSSRTSPRSLARGDHREPVAVDQHFGGARPAL